MSRIVLLRIGLLSWMAVAIGTYVWLQSGTTIGLSVALGLVVAALCVAILARWKPVGITAARVALISLPAACVCALCAVSVYGLAYREGPNLYRDLATGHVFELEGPRQESDNIRLIAPQGSVLVGADASLDRLPEPLRAGFRRLHLATYGWGFLQRAGVVALELAVLLAAALGLGLRILTWARPRSSARPPAVGDLATAATVGLAGLMFAAWCLVLVGWLRPWAVWGTLVLALASNAGPAVRGLRALCSLSWCPRRAGTTTALLAATLLLLQLLNFTDNITPVPRGWDALNQYGRVIAELAAHGGSVPSPVSYAWESLAAFALVAFGSPAVSLMLMAFVPGALLSALTYAAARRRCAAGPALLAACIVGLVPMVTFHAAQEHKVDLPAFMLGAAAVVLASRRRLVLAGVLCGVMTATKPTGVMFGIALGCAILHRFGWRASVRTGVRFGLAAALAWAPFGIKNAVDAPQLSLRSIALGGHGAKPLDYPTLTRDTGLDLSKHEWVGGKEEMARYRIGTRARDILVLPWTLTMQRATVRGNNVDPGVVPLAVLPAALWFLVFPWWRRRTTSAALATLGLVYWGLWGAMCEGILWYGMPGILVFALLAASLHQSSLAAGGWPGRAAALVVAVSIGSSLSMRVQSFGAPALLLYAGGTIEAQECERGLLPLADDVRAATAGDDGLVLQIGTGYAYFVRDSFDRVVQDPFADHMYSLYQERDDDRTLDRLRRAGVRHVLYDRNLYQGAQATGLPERQAAIEPFLFRKLRVVARDPRANHFLMRVP